MKNRTRQKAVLLYLNDEENETIEFKMQELGIENKSAYLRKMAVDGYIIKQDFNLKRKMVAELNKIGSNINQMAKVANTYGAGHIITKDLEDIRKELQKIWQQQILQD